MRYNEYDIVKILRDFDLEYEKEHKFFKKGIEGVIVESYHEEYLIEFEDDFGDVYYVLIEEGSLIKVG